MDNPTLKADDPFIQVDPSFKEYCKIAVVGNVDSGKSTLVGVLTKGDMDDGRGSARMKVFNFDHEKKNGRTSSIAQEIMGFRGLDQVLPERFVANKNTYWKDVVEKSQKVVTFIDLCGHEKYLKTTIFGLVAMVPDYSMIIVGANMGVSKMTREHLGLSLFLKIPFMVILTKTDIAPQNVHEETLDTLKSLIKSPAVRRSPVLFDENTPMDEIDKWAAIMHGNSVTPIFNVSSVTGQGLPQLRRFIARVSNRTSINKAFQSKDAPPEFDIQENFKVPGVERVVSGTMRSGTVKVGTVLLLGPNKSRQFKACSVKSIHINRVLVNEAQAGQYACLGLKAVKSSESLKRNDFRKGMVLLDPSLKPEPVWEFEANVSVLHHATTMGIGYQAVMHCGVVRQAVEIKRLNTKDSMRTGDVGLTRFRFVYNAEYMRTDQIIVIREGRTKVFGYVTCLISDKQLQLEAPTQN